MYEAKIILLPEQSVGEAPTENEDSVDDGPIENRDSRNTKNFDNNMNLEKSCDNALATAENNDLVHMILHDTEAIDFVNPSYADNLNECLPDNIISFSGTEICDAVEQKIENVGSPSNYSLNEPT